MEVRRLLLWREEGRVAEYKGGGREGSSSLLRCRGEERLILLSLPPGQ